MPAWYIRNSNPIRVDPIRSEHQGSERRYSSLGSYDVKSNRHPSAPRLGATTQERDSNDNYALNTVVLSSSTLGDLGELDGVAHITGFNNATENTALIGGETWVVLQDAWRTGFNDYVALRMDS